MIIMLGRLWAALFLCTGGMIVYYRTSFPSPLGPIELVCDETALVALWLPGQRPFASDAAGDHPILEQAAQWLRRYFAGEWVAADALPLRPEGTHFQKLIWKLLLEIPYGETRTYGALAKDAAKILGKPNMSAQAVGGAVGANPIAIIIPCHRCIGAGGKLTGYAGGIHYKEALLTLEGCHPSATNRQSRA